MLKKDDILSKELIPFNKRYRPCYNCGSSKSVKYKVEINFGDTKKHIRLCNKCITDII